MNTGLLGVTVERHGVISVLTVTGDLDLTTAAEFAERAAGAADDQTERFVLDLSGLRFIDCGGARALAAVTRAVPGDCPVIVRAVRPAVHRVLELLGLDLERQPQEDGAAHKHVRGRVGAGARVPDRPARRLQIAWTRTQHVMAETRMLVGMVAATEDQVAVTFARLAERRPASAEQLRQLSEDARREATRLRDWATAAGGRAARRIEAGEHDSGAGRIAGPLRDEVTRAESGPVVVREMASRETAGAPATREVISVGETRNCDQCGAVFIPRREHARFCSSPCRDSWDRERGGDMGTEASAFSWTVTAMRNVTEWLAAAGAHDRPQAFEAISDAVWWVTIVDATLNRHHAEAYDEVMRAQPAAERRLIDGTLGGLRFVRNQMGYHVGHADFIEPARSRSGGDDDPITTWWWKSLPEPALGWLPPRGKAWETGRYQAYQAHLAGYSIGETFGRVAAFLKLASARAIRRADRDPGDTKGLAAK